MSAQPSADFAPALLIREALAAPDVSPEKLSALLAVRQAWEADEARKAFSIAVSEFQRRCPIVEKGDVAHDKQYARMDRIWRAVRPLVGELGLSVTWQICEIRGAGADQICHVEGMLRHRAGHGEKLVQDIPLPELIRGQNKSQQLGSASTYAHRYAFSAALGVVVGDDDDGNGGVVEFIDVKEQKEILALVDACRGVNGFNEEVFWRFVGGKDLGKLPMARLADVLDLLNRRLGRVK